MILLLFLRNLFAPALSTVNYIFLASQLMNIFTKLVLQGRGRGETQVQNCQLIHH